MSASEVETQATKQHFVKMNRALINADEGDSDVEEDDPSKQYIYMELESTQGALADVDIDAMFNTTSVEEFMRGLSRRGTFAADEKVSKQASKKDAMELLDEIMQGKSMQDTSSASQTDRKAPKLQFGGDQSLSETSIDTVQDSMALRNKAMQNLKERRLRLK